MLLTLEQMHALEFMIATSFDMTESENLGVYISTAGIIATKKSKYSTTIFYRC